MNKLIAIVLLAGIALPSVSSASCDCGSTNEATACTATTLEINVPGGNRSIGFTWGFNSAGQPASCGQFANGDYWLAPAAGQNSVTITEIQATGGQIFADVNPQPEKMGLLREPYSHRVSSYLSVSNHDLNENIADKLPVSFNVSASVVAAVERDQVANGNCGTNAIRQGCVDVYNVVTVLDQVPADNGTNTLRPNVIRDSKELMSLDEFNLARLPVRAFFDGGDANRLEGIRKSWAHHLEVLSMRDNRTYSYSEGGRAFRAHLLVDDYAAGVAVKWHRDLTVLMSGDHSQAEQKAALASMLTYGKDIYYQVYNERGERERWFGTGAGQSLGRFPAAAFFAALASDTQFANVLKRASTTQVNLGGESVHELDQVNIGINGPIWGDGDSLVHENQFNSGRYWGEMLTQQKFNGAQYGRFGQSRGQRTMRDPYNLIDGPGGFPGTVYAGVSAGPIRALAAQMLLMPEMCDVVNYDPLVTYSLRISAEGRKVDNDICAPPDPRELTGAAINGLANEGVNTAGLEECDTFRARNCKYYGLSNDGAPTWGPDPNNLAKCILDSPALARSQGRVDAAGRPVLGRFSHIDQDAREFGIGYKVVPIESNWAHIHQGRSACQRVLRAPPKAPTNFREQVSQ